MGSLGYVSQKGCLKCSPPNVLRLLLECELSSAQRGGQSWGGFAPLVPIVFPYNCGAASPSYELSKQACSASLCFCNMPLKGSLILKLGLIAFPGSFFPSFGK